MVDFPVSGCRSFSAGSLSQSLGLTHGGNSAAASSSLFRRPYIPRQVVVHNVVIDGMFRLYSGVLIAHNYIKIQSRFAERQQLIHIRPVRRFWRLEGSALQVIEKPFIDKGTSDHRADNDNSIDPTQPLDYIRELPHNIAKEFITTWHYSKRVPTGKNVFFGWYVGQILYAVADYGIGVNPNIENFLATITKQNVTRTNLFELKRLCRTDPPNPDYPLTKFLSICHKLLKREHGIEFIVSFSDPEHNRFAIQKNVPYSSGGIYRAANFTYLGTTNAEIHVIDEKGIKRHRKYAYRFQQRENKKGNPITIGEARKILRLTTIKTAPKDRWFLSLGKCSTKNPEARSKGAPRILSGTPPSNLLVA